MRTVHRWVGRRTISVMAGVALLLIAATARAQTSVSGVAYVAYGFNLAKDTLTADSSLSHINNFDVTRAYINVNGKFAHGIVTRVTADVFGSGGAGGLHTFRLKYAYVAWTPDSNGPLTWKIGATQTPLLDWEEGLWDYRMQGTMPLERNGYISSSDFGVAVDGKWNSDQFSLQAGIFNGENYSTTTLGDQRKDFAARVSYRLMGTNDNSRVGGLRLTGYAQYGMPSSGGQRQRFLGMVSYRSHDALLAAEYAITKDSTTGGNTTVGGGATGAVSSRSGRVASVYGWYHFMNTRLSVVGRVDLVDPNTASANTGDQQTRMIAGLSYQVAPALRVMADYDGVTYQSGYVPGTAAAPNPNTSYAAYVGRQVLFLHAQFTY